MKSNFTLTILCLFISLLAFSQTQKKVLFIGNSYTGVNNLPLMVKSMTESAGDVLIYDAHTPGGQTLMNHASNPAVLQKINSNDWNYVVLQEQSQMTAFYQEYVQTNVEPYAAALCDMIRASNECTEPMFYMTWGRQNGDQSNCDNMEWMCTYEGMDDAIRATYIHMAETNVAELAPAGAVWRYIRENHPEINLYSGDESHPSLAGSYAAGCAFYATIFEKDPTLITWNSTLSEAVANTIRNAAQTIVYNELDSWDYTVNPSVADFTEVTNVNAMWFTNTSASTDSSLWYFGDGATSTEFDPIHFYTETGTYEVSLINFRCGQTDTLTKTFIIDTVVGIDNADVKSVIKIFPNPASRSIQIELEGNTKNSSYMITDVTGKCVIENSDLNAGSTIDISQLTNGMYILNVIADGQVYQAKIQKIE